MALVEAVEHRTAPCASGEWLNGQHNDSNITPIFTLSKLSTGSERASRVLAEYENLS